MSWIKIDDAFLDHAKFLEAGPLAGYLNICAIAWANRNLTDGFIPRAQVARLVNWDGIAYCTRQGEVTSSMADADALLLAGALVEFGLWEPAPGGFQIHDYLVHQRSAAQIRDDREKNADRQAKFRNTRRNGASNAASNGVTTAAVTSAKKLEVEVENTTPPDPPEGGRQRDRDAWKKAVLSWAVSVGVTGDEYNLLRAINQSKPWESTAPADEFRYFARTYFASALNVGEPS